MSNYSKEALRTALKNKIDVSYRIKPLDRSTDTSEKQLFVDTLDTLKQIEDRRDFMEDEIGIDMTVYEDNFFKVIENLFYIHYNEAQLEVIKLYLYERQPKQDWDGMIIIEKNKHKQEMPFETATDVWEVIQILK